MTRLSLRHTSLADLLKEFRAIDSDRNSEALYVDTENYNFAVVDPALYYGSYGGVIRRRTLSAFDEAGGDAPPHARLSHPFDETFSFVWWLLPRPPLVGTRVESPRDGRVLLPKEIFLGLPRKAAPGSSTVPLRAAGRSSYFR